MDVCIICQKDVAGKSAVSVKEDRIILAIRSMKQALKMAQNNKLYVCETCMEEHSKRRKSFEKSMLFFGVLAAIVVVLLFISMILSGRFDIMAIFSIFIIGVLILLFSLLFKYTPATEGPPKVVGTTASRTDIPSKNPKKLPVSRIQKKR